MANQIPIKVMCDGSGNTCGLAQFTSSDSVAIAAGGTGLTSQGICEFVQPGLYAVGCKVTYLGICAGKADTGVGHDNTYIGYAAGTAVTTGCQHTLIGKDAGQAITTCSQAVSIGYHAGKSQTFGMENTYVGYAAGGSATTADNNTAIGWQAGTNTICSNNTSVGTCAMFTNTQGQDNVAIGVKAGATQVAAGCNNVFVGSNAGAVSLCRDNVSIGSYAGKAATTGGGNVMIGACVGYGVVGGASNVYIGDKAGLANTSGNANVFVGNCAGCATTGSCCLIIGNGACDLITGDFSGGTFSVAGNVTIFDDANNADTSLSIGTGAAEALVVEALNGAANKTLEELRFTTKTASGTADHGKMSFYVDEAEIATIDDGGIDLASGLSFTVAGSAVTTSPGGSDTQIQYNNSGAFGGSSNLVWTNSSSTLDVSGTANAKELNVAASGASLASQNASKIILVDLTDPGTMWDVQAFLARARYTSWYQELGAPPMRGAMWLDNAGTSIVWWNLDTDAVYMSFTVAANNMIHGAGTTDLAFLDGKMYVGVTVGQGLDIVDFLSDQMLYYNAGGLYTYQGNIEERNDTAGIATLSTTPAIVSGVVSAVSAVRDPLRYDEFDRPKHWWAVNTGVSGSTGPVSVYNPVDDAIYDGGNLNSTITAKSGPAALAPNGGLALVVDLGSQEYVNWFSSVYSFYADFGTGWNEMYLNSGNGVNTHPFSSSVDWAALDIADAPPLGGQSNIVAVGGDEGLILAFAHTGNDSAKTAIIAVTSSYNTPYMKGARAGAYPLNDANDRGGGGNNLTNNNTVTFASGGPTGSYANFVAASNQSLTLADDADFGGMSELTLLCWFKRDIDSGAAMVLMGKYDTASAGDRSFLLQIDSADKINFQCITSAGSVGASPGNPATVIDTWYHVAATYDGTTMKVYLDGVLIGSAAQTGTVVDGTEPFCIGSHTSGSPNANWFDGQIAGAFVGSTALTEAEVNLEYQRGQRVLGGATATLANTDVKSIQIDQNTGLAAITTAANQTEIWDITTGLRESIDATTTATINDADVKLKSGAILPEYITGRSGAIEFDGQERNVLG